MKNKKAIIVHSGGMDSSLCLAHALSIYPAKELLAISFRYNQRHSVELERAALIARTWKVDHLVLDIDCLSRITQNALTDQSLDIVHNKGEAPNTLVLGRNGLMARIAAIHAFELGAKEIHMGVIEVESANSGYRDCTREYMDLMQNILRLDFDDQHFSIQTPLVKMTKKETMDFGHRLGVLTFLLEHTISCYEGIEKFGCGVCPACVLKNEGIAEFLLEKPDFDFSFRHLFA
jgi:7-cyano-7-deazaguanine synthase